MSNSNQSIEQLKKRFEELSLKKVKFETQRDAAASELADLKKQALGLYGSDDVCLLYTSPSPRDATLSRMPSSA